MNTGISTAYQAAFLACLLIASIFPSRADNARTVVTAAVRTPALDQKAVLDLEARIATAQLKRDFVFLDSVFAGDMLYIGSDGSRAGKNEYMNRIKKNRFYSVYINKDIGVRMYGDIAVAGAIQKIAGVFDGRKSSLALISTKVWVYRMNKWQVAHWQSTVAPASGLELLFEKMRLH